MNEMILNTYTQKEKLICDWTDEKYDLIQQKILKNYVSHGMIVDKVQEVISSKQSKWLEKYIGFSTQKRNEATNDF